MRTAYPLSCNHARRHTSEIGLCVGRQGEEVVEVGSVSVAELDWENPAHYEAVGGPFDFVLAADCVYRERLVEDLLRTVLAVTTHKSTGKPRSPCFGGCFLTSCQVSI